jgi:hypothetical protein
LKHGSYENQKGQVMHTPWKLSLCNDASLTETNYCILRRKRPAVCPCESSNYVIRTQTDPKLNSKTRKFECATKSVDNQDEYVIPYEWDPSKNQTKTPGLPHTMDDLLGQVAWRNTVILTAASYDYKDMVMSFVCNLRSLGAKHFVVAAFDSRMYEYLFLRGVPVFYEDVKAAMATMNAKMPKHVKLDLDDCGYGSACFRKITKMKSRIVLKILKQGYNVLWSDADIVWFKDQTKTLLDRIEASPKPKFYIQSNEPDMNKDSNGIRRINSGYYLVKSSNESIKWFQNIVDHAANTSLTEQPSFYDVLCGVKGEFKTGPDTCEREGFETELLDRRIYPNGATLGFWNKTAEQLRSEHPDMAILHNNWLKGTPEKIARQDAHGWFQWESSIDSCRWPWLKKTSSTD